MKSFKLKVIIVIILSVCLAGTAFAIEVTWTEGLIPPGTGLEIIYEDIMEEIQSISPFPKDFIRAFADASVFSSHSATQRAFGEYEIFAVTVGGMAGLRLPASPANIANDFKNSDVFMDRLQEKGDIYTGINIQSAFQVGFNSSFLFDRFHLGLRFGFSDISPGTADLGDKLNIGLKMFHIGPVAHYNLLEGIDAGALKWRGISIGTGLLYQKTVFKMGYVVQDVVSSVVVGGITTTIDDPEVTFEMIIDTLTIPLEINTSVHLLWFLNINFGLGADFGFGKNTTTIGLHSGITIDGVPRGSFLVNAGGSMNPVFFNPKVMTNFGLKLGPVILDIPVTYYFGNKTGFNAGVTFGVVW